MPTRKNPISTVGAEGSSSASDNPMMAAKQLKSKMNGRPILSMK